MLSNYYTLSHIARQLHATLQGSTVAALFSQNKRELVVCFELSAPGKATRQEFLILSCEPAGNFLYKRDDFQRARKNSVDLFSDVVGTTVESIGIHSTDRAITFALLDKRLFVLQLYGSKANALLVGQEGFVEDAFLRRKELVGQLHVQRPDTDPQHPGSFQAFRDGLSEPLAQALKKQLPRLGALLARELMFRALGNHDYSGPLELGQTKSLYEAGLALLSELRSRPSPRIYYRGAAPVAFAIVPLQHLAYDREEIFDSIFKAIQMYVGSSRRSEQFSGEKESIDRILTKELEQTERTLSKMAAEAQSAERAASYEIMGKLLMANLHAFEKGSKSVDLENILDPSKETVRIQLDPHLTPTRNAERYFEKAKRARHSLEEQKRRTDELGRRKETLERLLRDYETVESADGLADFINGNHDVLRGFGIRVSKSGKRVKEEQIPFRVFTVAGGFQVWAGKSGENNDLLSTRHTKQNDLWFHARSVGGSHVVLKVGTGKGEVSKQAMEQAASIAAYYSKMKGAKMVPVSMCEGKYVRKPKGAPPGTVTIEREKMLFVEPALPESKAQA